MFLVKSPMEIPQDAHIYGSVAPALLHLNTLRQDATFFSQWEVILQI